MSIYFTVHTHTAHFNVTTSENINHNQNIINTDCFKQPDPNVRGFMDTELFFSSTKHIESTFLDTGMGCNDD